MYAIDIDDNSIRSARENVRRNDLTDRITVVQAADAIDPFAVLQDEQWSTVVADFTMCNPPFFDECHAMEDGDIDEGTMPNRTGKRPHPSAAKTGIHHELATTGGEVEFVAKMIRGSQSLGERIKVFSSMVGKKSSLQTLELQLKVAGIVNYCTTAFCQGRTMRWAIAWSLQTDLPLRDVPTCGPTKAVAKRKPFRFKLTDCASIDDAHRRLCNVLGMLSDVVVSTGTTDTNSIASTLVAYKDTWTRQRQKKRAERKRTEATTSQPSDTEDTQRPATTDQGSTQPLSKPLLELSLVVKQMIDRSLELQIDYLAGPAGVNGAHQLQQFIINRWSDI